MVTETTMRIDPASAFSIAETLTSSELEAEGRVRFLIVNGRQDDGLWGPIGALWLSLDERRGGFLVNPWALWGGSEIVRGFRGALRRGWTPASVYEYWQREVWPRGYTVEEARETESLFLLHELVAAL